MRCKYCGGEINLSVGRCTSCGCSEDSTDDIRILHDLGDIAEKYGLDPNHAKYDEPEAHGQESVQPLEQRTSAAPLPPDLKSSKKPNIQLSTYLELLGENNTDSRDVVTESDTTVPEDPSATVESDHPSSPQPARPDSSDHEEAESSEDASPLRRKLNKVIDKVDTFTAPVTEKMRLWVETKTPTLHRAQSSSKLERLALMGVLLAGVLLLVLLVSFIIASIPASVSGEWQVSEEGSQSIFTVEFSGGKVTARVYDHTGEAHVYKRGTYETERQNGRDLLTIEYEDGSVSHLYYTISGRTGEFINVDTGSSSVYRRTN